MSTDLVMVGDIVHGHANGAFGRDHYDCSRVEAVARDWIVVRHLNDGEVCVASSAECVIWASQASKSYTDTHSSGCSREASNEH